MCTGLEGEASVDISAHVWYHKDETAPTGEVKADTQQSAMAEAWEGAGTIGQKEDIKSILRAVITTRTKDDTWAKFTLTVKQARPDVRWHRIEIKHLSKEKNQPLG